MCTCEQFEDILRALQCLVGAIRAIKQAAYLFVSETDQGDMQQVTANTNRLLCCCPQ